MQPTPPHRWSPQLRWLLLGQILWIPWLLLRAWSPPSPSTPDGRREELPPLPAASERRSSPPSLEELLKPAPNEGDDAASAVRQVPSAGGLILLNRPGAGAREAARQAQPGANRPEARGGKQPKNPQEPSGASGVSTTRRPPATAPASPAQLLGGSLGLEELRRTLPQQPPSR